MCVFFTIPFSESWLDILLLPITILGFWIAFRQDKDDKIRKSKKPDLMNLMNFIYENYMKFSYLFDLREHDLVYEEVYSEDKNLKNDLYVSFDDFNLNYIVSSSQVPDYIIEPDKFAQESKEIYEMTLKIKQDLNQYNETLKLFCEDNGKWERNSIDDYRNILERISKETFLNTLELYNSLQDEKTYFKKRLPRTRDLSCPEKEIRLRDCENNFSSFKENREKQIINRLEQKKYSANNIWREPQSLLLLRSFMCIPYIFENSIEPRKQHRLLYHTFLYDQLSIGNQCIVDNKLIKKVTNFWIKAPKTSYTHFFVCDYITTIEEFLTYSSLKSKFTSCKFSNVYEHSNTEAFTFVGTKNLESFFSDIRRFETIFITVGLTPDMILPKDKEFIYINANKKEEVQSYMDEHND